jgi:hypothetical protein
MIVGVPVMFINKKVFEMIRFGYFNLNTLDIRILCKKHFDDQSHIIRRLCKKIKKNAKNILTP